MDKKDQVIEAIMDKIDVMKKDPRRVLRNELNKMKLKGLEIIWDAISSSDSGTE